MQPLSTDRLYSFSVPKEYSLLQALRQQLWAVIVTHHWSSQNLSAHSIPARLINNGLQGSIAYISALPQQLSAQHSSPISDLSIVGNRLMAQLQTFSPPQTSFPWCGWVNQQGYLCCQPTDSAMTAWLTQILQGEPSLPEALPPAKPLQTSSIALQYVYARCTQLRQVAVATDQQPLAGSAELIMSRPLHNQLLFALVALWDASTNHHHRQVFPTSQKLVEHFLEFEQTYHRTNHLELSLAHISRQLVSATQITVGMILQRHWGIQPQPHW